MARHISTWTEGQSISTLSHGLFPKLVFSQSDITVFESVSVFLNVAPLVLQPPEKLFLSVNVLVAAPPA